MTTLTPDALDRLRLALTDLADLDEDFDQVVTTYQRLHALDPSVPPLHSMDIDGPSSRLAEVRIDLDETDEATLTALLRAYAGHLARLKGRSVLARLTEGLAALDPDALFTQAEEAGQHSRTDDTLWQMARAYAAAGRYAMTGRQMPAWARDGAAAWPLDEAAWDPPTDPAENFIKAAALLLAEAERHLAQRG